MKTKINGICYISMLLLGIYISVYQSVIGTISKEYAISSTVVGIIISLHFIGSIAAPVIFGEISDRVGKKPVILITFSLLIVGLLGVYLFKSLIAVSIGIFLIGSGFAVIEGSLSGVLAEVNPEKTGKAMNFSQMFFSIGAVSGPLISMFATNRFGSWRSTFLLMIIAFAGVTVYMSQLQLGERKSKPEAGAGLISWRLFKEKIFILLCISIFAYVGIEEGVAFWLGSYFENTSGSAALGAYTLSGYWGSMVIGRYLASRFHSRYKLFLQGGLLASLIFIVLGLLFRGSMASVMFFILTGFGFSAVWPVIMSLTADRYPEYSGTALGIMMTSGAGGGTVIPLLMGTVSGFAGIETAFWTVPVIIILMLAILMKTNTLAGKGNVQTP